MKLFLSPHNDDESLFAAFTLLRERPVVCIVTDSFIQYARGDGITAQQRWEETQRAMKILNCPVVRLGIRDDALDPRFAEMMFRRIVGFDAVYAPAQQGGHIHHDIVNWAAKRVFPNVIEYCTYGDGTKRFYANEGEIRVDGTEAEWALKRAALAQYESQMPRSWAHFAAVDKQPEWLTPPR